MIQIIVKVDRLVLQAVFENSRYSGVDLVELKPEEAVELGSKLAAMGKALIQLREVPS